MKPLWPFYGSKWRDAKRYPAPTAHVIEPFAGSAGYSVYYEPENVTLIDADPFVVGVWDYLINVSESEVASLPDLAAGQSVDDFALPQEAKWLIGFWLNRGSAQPKKTQTAFSARTDRSQLVWGERARSRIIEGLPKVRRWSINLGTFDDAPNDPAATYFVDPPYVDKGRYYRHNKVDHDVIAKWIDGVDGHVIACEQAGATWLPFEPLASIKSTRGRSDEVVWLRGRLTSSA